MCVPLGQGAAATWPEESYVQGRIDGTPGRRVRPFVKASASAPLRLTGNDRGTVGSLAPRRPRLADLAVIFRSGAKSAAARKLTTNSLRH
jgi:hypothetical protein